MAKNGPKWKHKEWSVRDRNDVPVLLLYDRENDYTIMASATENGELKVIGYLIDQDGDPLAPTGVTENNQNKMITSDAEVRDLLDSLHTELKIMNIHLSNVTDMQIDKDDIGDY